MANAHINQGYEEKKRMEFIPNRGKTEKKQA